MNVLHIFAGLAVVVPGIYMLTANQAQSTIKNKRVCLLIAHPDDEAMFFSPTVLALTRPENGNHVKILCLSTGMSQLQRPVLHKRIMMMMRQHKIGWKQFWLMVTWCAIGDADGLGDVRKQELVKSGLALGLQSEDDVFVVDNPTDFPDSMTRMWDKNLIARLLGGTFAPKFGHERKNNLKPTAAIDILITFDSNGVSSHPNHISLYLGARSFIQALTSTESEWPSPVDLYTLTSVGIVRKYSAVMDFVPTLLS
jgi:N-acetylglucosaminylphosphatidylinositol deacetylase